MFLVFCLKAKCDWRSSYPKWSGCVGTWHWSWILAHRLHPACGGGGKCYFTSLTVSALTWLRLFWLLPGVKPKEAKERQEREGNEMMMMIKVTNTDIPLWDQWGARHWNNCCQPAARRVTSSFTKSSNEHKKILNPPPAQMKGLSTGGMERRSEQLLKKLTCSCI